MAVNPMQRKARNSFLLGMILSLLITGTIIVFLFLQLKKVKDEQAAEEALKVNVYVLQQDVKSGQILTEDMFATKTVSKETIPNNATSMSDVIQSWYLQTKDGKTINRDENGLYISEADNIIELDYKDGQYITKDDGKSVSLRNTSYTDEIDGETRYLMTSTSVENDTTRVYEDLNTGNCYVYKIAEGTGTVTKEYLEFNEVPLLAKVDMKANTVITRDLVVQSDAVVTDDVRKQEYNMVVLPVDLMTDDYVDIRLMLPNGQDFIVVSKAQVTVPVNGDGTYVSDTISINLREDEILSMSNAIVEAYGILGSKLYATRYAEPGLQAASLPTYTPNNETSALIESNPNIVNIAKEELKSRYSDQAKNIRNQHINSEINKSEDYKENIEENMQNKITNSDAARKLYLETLGQ